MGVVGSAENIATQLSLAGAWAELGNRKLQWMQEYFILKNKFIKHQVQYHVLNMKLASGLNILPARNVKMR